MWNQYKKKRVELGVYKPLACEMPDLFAGYFLYFSAKLGDAGFASHSFDKKGIAQSPLVGDEADMDAAMDAAIEAGAEDVVVATDDDDQNVLQVRYWWWQLLAYTCIS